MPAGRPVPDDFICFAIYSTSMSFSRVYKPLLARLGVTYPQYLTLVSLWAQDNQNVSSLGEALFLESSTLTPLLKRLEALGLVTRSRDPEDERQVRVRLTKKGKSLEDKAKDYPSCVDGATGLTTKDLHKLREEILSVRTALQKFDGHYPGD